MQKLFFVEQSKLASEIALKEEALADAQRLSIELTDLRLELSQACSNFYLSLNEQCDQFRAHVRNQEFLATQLSTHIEEQEAREVVLKEDLQALCELRTRTIQQESTIQDYQSKARCHLILFFLLLTLFYRR
jgi:hypothetical protein